VFGSPFFSITRHVSVHCCEHKINGTASARTSVSVASHRMGPQPSDFKMIGHQLSDRKVQGAMLFVSGTALRVPFNDRGIPT
jgi:hypothetical protein